ncbi:MAG: hypothetical protein Q8867_00765 [Bacteroidota bacterium]|nr:hypothetical protein [Bacteroidota bacterium]
MRILTEYPVWFILFCLILGGIYAFLLYYRTGKNEIPGRVMAVMTAFRFLSVFIISFLLLSPLVRKTSENVEKPILLFAQDNSLSIVMGKDSSFYRSQYPEAVKSFLKNAGDKFNVINWSFSEKNRDGLDFSFSGKQTDISSLADEFASRYLNRNVGALIIATDGIFNKGTNPYYSLTKAKFPVYTIALGDTTVYRDLILRNVLYNPTVQVGEPFPLEIQIAAMRCAGEQADLEIKKGGQSIFSKKIPIRGKEDLQKVNVMLDAKEKGIQHYTISLKPLQGEFTDKNNSRDIFIEVTDQKQKVAILYDVPHPDIAAIRQALEASSRFDVDEFRMTEFTADPGKYDLIILCQIPSVSGYNNLSRITGSSASLLYIVGSTTSIPAFNALGTGLTIQTSSSGLNEIQAIPNENFSFFNLERNIIEGIRSFPPMNSPAGLYQSSGGGEILLSQKIGNVSTHFPLILFMPSASRKTGVITGENIWKWRLADYQQNGDHLVFDELIGKIAQYLCIREEKSFFIVKWENQIPEDNSVEFHSELYNESYELINQPDVNLVITDEKNKNYHYVFGRTEKAYYINTGSFAVGTYKFTASVKAGRNLYTKKGEFIVSPLNLEAMNTVADHNLLFRIAASHNGEMIYPRDLEKLSRILDKREDIKPVSYRQQQFTDLTGNLWAFLIILALLSVEWFLRKRYGIT